MWIINTEDTDALLDPVEDHSLQFVAELRGIFAFEIKWINVLIFLWWIFRVLHGAIGSLKEPFLVFFDVRMVRRALKC